MKLEKIIDTYDKVKISVIACNETESIIDTDKERINYIYIIMDTIIDSLNSGSDSLNISIQTPKIRSILTNINATITNNMLPYFDAAHNAHLKSQILTLETYYIELQSCLSVILVLGNPLKSKILQTPTHTQLKKTEENIEKTHQLVNKLNDDISKLESNYQNKISEIDTKITNTEQKLSNVSTNQTTTLSSQIDSIRLTIEKLKEDFFNEKTELIEKSKKELDVQESKAKDIVDLISKSGQASIYGESAENYQKAKTGWQITTIVFLLLTFIIGIFSVIPNNWLNISMPQSEWEFIFRGLITISLGTASAYCARLAHKNYKLEVRTRLIYLDLLTIDSFIREAKDPDVLKANLANKYFGRFDEFNDKDDEDGLFLTPRQTKDLITLIKEIKK